MDAIISALSPVLQLLAVAAVSYLVRLAAQKLHLSIDNAQEDALKQLAVEGVLWAEEQARKAYVLNGGTSPSGQQKRKMAVDYVERGAKRRRLKAHRKMAPSELEDIVEAQLAAVRPAMPEAPAEE